MTLMRASLLAALTLVSCTGSEPEPGPEPGALMAGFARARIPAPVGIGTVGYGGFGITAEPSPFAEIYPATTRIHGHPEFKAVAVSRGEGHEVVFVRMDSVGVFQQLRQGVLIELESRHGRSFDDVVLFGATHTHSGPGRIIDSGGPFDLIADRFMPDFYLRMVTTLADVVDEAMEDLQPARVGVTVGNTAEGHNDRRCEDGRDYTNDTLPLIGIERDGELQAVVANYAIHGTALGIEELTLSQDVSGAIEEAVEDRFDHPVEVLLFNSWAADMAPSSPTVTTVAGATQPSGYDRMEAVGLVVADEIEARIADLDWHTEPHIKMETHRVRIDRDVLGYDDDTFDYEFGGVYCATGEPDCDPETTIEGLDEACLPFTEEFPAPNQTVMSAGQVGPMHFVTFPGEPGTLLAEEVMQTLGVEPFMFFGYSQDYLGYSILEDDWWQGGYEASGALWGPKQGEHLKEAAIDAYERTYAPNTVASLAEPPPVAAFDVGEFDAYEPMPGESVGTVLTQPVASAGTDVVVMTVSGEDPWVGTPLAILELADGTPVLRPNGMPVDSDTYAFWVDLLPTPGYRDEEATSRQFAWTFSMPATKSVPGLALDGDYRLRVEMPGGSDIISDTFTVTPAGG
ncbi:MAG: neutral/alkaline non-lysosomal ceramidase N-terminal domain-containing protein [Proteobacteria bacterium]|nr:neutral/alkaline non-lysosomal ceramidase N-terminal domain-containing protein [Pseudomonadota bacterium]